MAMPDPKPQLTFLKSPLSHSGVGKEANLTSQNLPASQNVSQFMMRQRSVLGWQLKNTINLPDKGYETSKT